MDALFPSLVKRRNSNRVEGLRLSAQPLFDGLGHLLIAGKMVPFEMPLEIWKKMEVRWGQTNKQGWEDFEIALSGGSQRNACGVCRSIVVEKQHSPC